MPLLIPASANYPSPLVAVPSFSQDEPDEGRKQVSCEIDWGNMGGAAKCVYVNLQNNATLNISQISTIAVDNSQSGADVTFIFPDTSYTIVVPAGSPAVVYPVFSNACQMYVSAPAALLQDVTRFQLLNYAHFPADIPATIESQAASTGGTVIGSFTTNLQVIPLGINGTLKTLQVLVSTGTIAADTQWVLTVQDGSGRVLVNQMNFIIPAGFQGINSSVLDLNGLNWRFSNGLTAQFIHATGAATAVANTFADYTTP